MAWITATIVKRGGTCKYSTLYYHTASPYGWFEDPNNTSAGSIGYVYPKPSKPGCEFQGGHATVGGSSYTIISSEGRLFSPPTSVGAISVYLSWEGCPSAAMSLTNLSGGSSTVIYDPETGNLYADASMTTPLPATTVTEGGQPVVAWGPIVLPSKECYAFRGYWSASNNTGTLYIDAQGYVRQALVDTLAGMTANDTLTLYAKGEEVSKKLTLSVNGGSGGLSAIYNSLADRSKWYADSLCAGDPITSVPIPGKITSSNVGYVFNGYKYSSTVYIDADGTLTSSLTSLTNFTNRTATAQWQSTTKMTVNANGGEGGDAFFYWCSSRSAYFHAVDGVLTQTTAIVPPTYPGYAFAGLYTAATGGTQKVAADGTIASGLTSATTLYAQWTKTAFPVTFSGAPETLPLFYVKATGGGLYRDAECEDAVAAGDLLWDEPPTKDGHVFLGVFAEDASSSVRYTTAAGAATADFAALTATGDVTVYCLFAELQPITFDDAGGTGGAAPLWYLDHALYADSHGETPASWPLAVPTRECFEFLGYFDGAGDAQYVTANGAMTQALTDIVTVGISEPLDLLAQWDRITWRVTLGEDGTVYSLAGGGSGWTSDPEGTNAITSVPVPEREGYVFLGYFTTGGVQVVDSVGVVLAFAGGDGDIALTAHWNAITYTLSFSDGSTAKSVTYGSLVGTLPTPTVPQGLTFVGWMVDGTAIDATTVWAWAEDRIAAARFVVPSSAGFNEIVDWFGLASSSLVPISSDSGDDRQRVVVSHMGKYTRDYSNSAKDPVAVSGTWRNPSVTYMVVRDMTLRVTLGRAYAAKISSGTMTVSGYMIATVRVNTGMKAFPTVTVSAVANEGANAINQFALSVAVKARARPQNLLSAVSAGAGHLHSLSLTAACQPVVVAENMMPCASDVVNGVMDVEAETLAPAATAAPTAGGGFAEVGVVQAGSSGDYRRWKIAARKEMV